jgi:murein DD-endopeptidase MepM/ murein hydrolase activator NlpD
VPWDWALETEGALAREPQAENWFASVAGTSLKRWPTSVTVAAMHPAPPRRRPAPRARRNARRTRRRAFLVAVGVAILVVLAVSAFRPDGRPVVGTPASATRLLPPPPPSGIGLAVYGRLHVSSPINERVITAIGYHGAGGDALAFDPVGRQANVGVATRFFHRIFGGGGSGGVVYYQLGEGQGPSTGALDVGAAPGADVYAPTDGTVVGLRDYVLNGKKYGSVIDIEPIREPSVVLSVSHVDADPALTVGSTISASTSRIGRVIDLSGAERLALSRYTRDAGNYVELVLHPAGSVPLR